MKITQIDENTIKVDKEETISSSNTYSYDFLISQRDAIQRQADDFAANRQKELDEINVMIGEADKLGIISKNPIKIGA